MKRIFGLLFLLLPTIFATSLCGMDIFEAAETGNYVRICELIAAKADINVRNHDGRTPLHLAASSGHLESVKALIAANANVNTGDNYRRAPLFEAVGSDQPEIVDALIANKAEVNTLDYAGCTALHLAALCGRARIVKILIAAKADVNADDINGMTPLHATVSSSPSEMGSFGSLEANHLEIVKVLIDAGADVNIRDDEGRTPLDWAADNGHTKSVKIIKDHLERKEMIALLGASSLKLGANSPLNALPIYIYQNIFEWLKRAER